MLKREMMKTAGTVAALDWNAILGDTIKEKYEALYIKLRELDSVLRTKAGEGKVNTKKVYLGDHLTILTSREIASIYDVSHTGPPGLPSDAAGIIYHGTVAHRWKLYSDPKIDSNKLLLGSEYNSKYCAVMTIANFPLEKRKKEKKYDDTRRLEQIADGDANLDIFHFAQLFVENEDVGKGTYDADSFESTYNLEHTPICLGTTIGTTTGSIIFGDAVSSTFVVDETGRFTFTRTVKSNMIPLRGHLDLETGEMVLTWPMAIPSRPESLRPRCVISYEYDREASEAREREKHEYDMHAKEAQEQEKEFIITIDGKKNLDTVGGLIEHLQQYDSDMQVALLARYSRAHLADRVQSLLTHPVYRDKEQAGMVLVLMPDPERSVLIKKSQNVVS